MEQNNTAMLEQGSEEWKQSRCGIISASRMSDVTAKIKTGYAASRKNYMSELIVERLTNITADFYMNAAMQHGTDTEPQARAAYEFINDLEVKQVGFIKHPKMDFAGASPDGLVGDDGLIEIKCPTTGTHIELLVSKKIPKKYFDQMQFQMCCTGRKWCDYMSFDPRMPEHLNKLIIRVDRDDKYIQGMEIEVIKFNSEIDEKLKILEAL